MTYGTATMKQEWRKFIDSLRIDVSFLHKDEFHEQYDHPEEEFPSAFIDRNGVLKDFITVEEMNSNQTLEELMEMVRIKLENQK